MLGLLVLGELFRVSLANLVEVVENYWRLIYTYFRGVDY